MANRRNTYELHLYLPETLREPLKRLAEREDRSVTKLVERILRREVAAAAEDAWAYTPEHRAQVAAALAEVEAGEFMDIGPRGLRARLGLTEEAEAGA